MRAVACSALLFVTGQAVTGQAVATSSALPASSGPGPAVVELPNGEPPSSPFGARDIFRDVPAIPQDRIDALSAPARNLQVLSRARALNLDGRAAVAAWSDAETSFARAKAQIVRPLPPQDLVFAGTRVSELNALLSTHGRAAIKVTSFDLELDQPLRIAGAHLVIDLGQTRLQGSGAMPYAVRIEGAQDVRLIGGFFDHLPGWAVLVAGSHAITLSDMRVDGLDGGGVVVTGSDEITIWRNRFQRLGAAPVMLHGHTHDSVVAFNDISDNLGASNWHAGVVVSDRNADIAADPNSLLLPDNHGIKEQPIVTRLVVPQGNVIAFNEMDANRSSGIYLDGAARTAVVDNRITRNSKEGMCIDNGSAANLIVRNIFEANGKRWGKSDLDLKQDFVAEFGRLADGTSPAKVAAISVDNAAFNQILLNTIDGNFGGGIKLVRTDYFNTVALNTILDNNEGRNDRFHFFGIELGAAHADVPVSDLDFTPSHGNLIASNLIRGSHYSGVFVAGGATGNEITGNQIFGATHWGMESVQPQDNITRDNLADRDQRNINSGLGVGRVIEGIGHFDPPPKRPANRPSQR